MAPKLNGSRCLTVFQLLLLLLLLSSAASIRCGLTNALTTATNCSDASPYLEKFVETLSFPPVLDLSHHNVTIGAYKVLQKLHRDLPSTTLYAFGTSQDTAGIPGPTLKARRHIPAYVRWENHIPDEYHFLQHSVTVEWADPSEGGVPIVVHLHGAEVPSIYDGNPDAWFTPKNETGPAFVTQDYVYPNSQLPAALWYHDHTLGITRLNVLAGLSGLYLLRPTEEEERRIGLPDGAPLIFKDYRFFANGSLSMPDSGVPNTSEWCPEWYDVWHVNGRAWPVAHVFARPYRFRSLNACNSRFIALHLSDSRVPFFQIGTDGGFLREVAAIVGDDVMIASPGERADLIMDFSGLDVEAGVLLLNEPVEPSERFPTFTGNGTRVIMKFVVVGEGGLQEGLIEDADYYGKLSAHMQAASSPLLTKNKVDGVTAEPAVRQIKFVPHLSETHLIYQYTIGDEATWHDPVDVEPVVGSYEVWEVINMYYLVHNFHMHLVQFQVMDTQSIDAEAYRTGDCSLGIPFPRSGSCFLGDPQPPALNFQGWKDTFALFGNTVVRILVHFATTEGRPYAFDATQGPSYAMHCHDVQHEDHSMLRPFRLLPSAANDTAQHHVAK